MAGYSALAKSSMLKSAEAGLPGTATKKEVESDYLETLEAAD
jgi:hypothetical protein